MLGDKAATAADAMQAEYFRAFLEQERLELVARLAAQTRPPAGTDLRGRRPHQQAGVGPVGRRVPGRPQPATPAEARVDASVPAGPGHRTSDQTGPTPPRRAPFRLSPRRRQEAWSRRATISDHTVALARAGAVAGRPRYLDFTPGNDAAAD